MKSQWKKKKRKDEEIVKSCSKTVNDNELEQFSVNYELFYLAFIIDILLLNSAERKGVTLWISQIMLGRKNNIDNVNFNFLTKL